MEHNSRLRNTRKLCQQRDPKGKTSHSDGKNFHYIWGDGRTASAAFSNEDVKAAYEERGEEQTPLGIHGTSIAVDWDSCVAAGLCMSVCPVQTFQWFRTEQDISASDCLDTTFEGTEFNRNGRKTRLYRQITTNQRTRLYGLYDMSRNLS